jgi:hypothetical protein
MTRSFRTHSLALTTLAVAAAIAFGATPAQAGGPFQYFPVTPCRVFDTRSPTGPTGGAALPNPGPHDFRIQGNCGVPNGAQAVTINATVVTPSTGGDLRLYPVGAPLVNVATLAYPGGDPALANGAIVPLGPVSLSTDKDLRTLIGMGCSPAPCGTIHLIVDVTGYFE